MREGGEKNPFEIQEQRDKLAEEVRDVRKQRDEKRKEGATLKSKVLGRSEKLSGEAEGLNTEARNRLEKGKRAIEHALEGYQMGLEELEGASTDHTLIRWYFKRLHGNTEAHPIATDTFIDKSREEYNAAWLARELVQNFVDHNSKARGTLNGVSIEKQDFPEDEKKKRFVITGDWVFEDPTGVISPHSENPADVHTAGGNGIGLKQTAIRYLRDFGVSKFEVEGENWAVDYQLIKASEVNQQIETAGAKAKQPITKKVRHDWLIGQLQATERGGKCAYTIETDNAQVIAALDQLQNLGVSERNEFLQNPDFKNNQGSIKWLPPREGQESKGRLFINGQVMNYGAKGEKAENYWVGPEYVTLQLNDIAYKMSVDRPPVQSYELNLYLSNMIRSMTPEQVIEQLQRSEPIWTTIDDRRAGASVVVSSLINNLRWNSKYKKEDFEKHFGGKKYLAKDSTISPAQEKDLQQQGYTLCPAEFESIGMAKASSRLSNLEVASSQKPNTFRADSGIEKLAEESGIQVAYEDLTRLKPDQLIALVRDRIAPHGFEVTLNEANPNIVRLKLNIDLPKELLAKILPNPKTEQQKLLYFLRGVAFQGLEENVFKRIFLAQGEYVTTFNTQHDSATEESVLFVRNIKASSDQGVFVELEFEDEHLKLKSILNGGAKATLKPKEAEPVSVQKEPETGSELTTGKEITGKKPEIVVKEVESALTPEQLAEPEKVVPGIASAIKQLEDTTQKIEQKKAEEKTRIEKYKEWRDSDEAIRLAEENAGYINGRALGEIVSAYNRAEIPVAVAVSNASEEERQLSSQLKDIKATLQEAINKINPDGEVENFEMVFEPQPRQLAQLGLLRIYAYLTTAAKIENKLFVFRGTGTTGINMGREAIGIHEKELDQNFLEAVGIFTHELAHNEHMNHDVGFMTTMEALFLETNRKLTEIALKAKNGEPLTEDEETILSVIDKWDKLRAQQE